MKFVAALYAPMASNWLGLPSRVCACLGGKPMIRWVVDQLLDMEEIDRVAIVTDGEGLRTIREYCADSRVVLVQARHREEKELLEFRAGRKWAMNSWIGGVANTFVYYEEGTCEDWLKVFDVTGADALVKLPSHTPFVDRGLIAAQIEYFSNVLVKSSVCVSAAPPGWNYEIWIRSALEEERKCAGGLRNTLMLRPGETSLVPLAQPFVYPLDEDLLCCKRRITAETRRGWRIIEGLWAHYGEDLLGGTAVDVVDSLHRHQDLWRGRVPADIEIEICGSSQTAPGWSPIAHVNRSMMDMRLFKKIIDEITAVDDVLMTVGGHGEPLLHPGLLEMLRYARDKGILGIHVATNGIGLHGDVAKALMDVPVDVMTVQLNAVDNETYQRIYGEDHYDQVVANVLALLSLQAEADCRLPYIVPEIVKMGPTEEYVEEFFDYWYARTGWVVIRGFNDYCGQLEDLSIAHLNLATRIPCERLDQRMFVLSSGLVPYCGQDFRGRHPVGDLNRDGIAQLWQGEKFTALRAAHRAQRFEAGALCPGCREWDHL